MVWGGYALQERITFILPFLCCFQAKYCDTSVRTVRAPIVDIDIPDIESKEQLRVIVSWQINYRRLGGYSGIVDSLRRISSLFMVSLPYSYLKTSSYRPIIKNIAANIRLSGLPPTANFNIRSRAFSKSIGETANHRFRYLEVRISWIFLKWKTLPKIH